MLKNRVSAKKDNARSKFSGHDELSFCRVRPNVCAYITVNESKVNFLTKSLDAFIFYLISYVINYV